MVLTSLLHLLYQVFIDTSGPEFIGWDDINGIDEVSRPSSQLCNVEGTSLLTCTAQAAS